MAKKTMMMSTDSTLLWLKMPILLWPLRTLAAGAVGARTNARAMPLPGSAVHGLRVPRWQCLARAMHTARLRCTRPATLAQYKPYRRFSMLPTKQQWQSRRWRLRALVRRRRRMVALYDDASLGVVPPQAIADHVADTGRFF